MRIAAVLADRCQPKKCNKECERFCPLNRTGAECVVFGERGKPVISETLCQGCEICVNKCQFKAKDPRRLRRPPGPPPRAHPRVP